MLNLNKKKLHKKPFIWENLGKRGRITPPGKINMQLISFDRVEKNSNNSRIIVIIISYSFVRGSLCVDIMYFLVHFNVYSYIEIVISSSITQPCYPLSNSNAFLFCV